MKTYGGVEIYLQPFLTLALEVVSRFQTSAPTSLGQESSVPIDLHH